MRKRGQELDRKEYQHEWYMAHRKEKIEAAKQRYQDNKEVRKKQQHEWYMKNKLKISVRRDGIAV